MASQRKTDFISPEKYLELERAAEFRSEYISGEMFAMAAPSKAHGEIVLNVGGELRDSLRNTPCQGNVGVSVSAPDSFLIPDLVVYCDGGDFTKQDNILQNPIVIFEVLSPTTSDFDRGHKWILYQQLASLMHYVLISQDEPRVEVFSRERDGGWHYIAAMGLDSTISLNYIDCQLTLSNVYERVGVSK